MDVFSNPSIACRLTHTHPTPPPVLCSISEQSRLFSYKFGPRGRRPFGCNFQCISDTLSIDGTWAPAHAKCNRWNRPKIIPVILLFRRNRVHVSIHAGKAVDFLSETQSCLCMDSLTHPPDSCLCLLNHVPFLITGNQMLTHLIRCPLAVWCWSMLGLKASPPLFLLFLPSSVQASDIYDIYFYLNIYGSSIVFF